MRRCIIITSCIENNSVRENVDIRPDDYIICADAGFEYTHEEGIIPNIVIGDFDSFSFDEYRKIIDNDINYSDMGLIKTVPEKDYPDTFMCVEHGLSQDIDSFVIIGGLGGRFDHSSANIQTLSYLLDNEASGWILDGANSATMIQGPDELVLEVDTSKYFSAYSFTEKCTGVYEIGSKYTLYDATLSQSIPIGTSNEFLDDPVSIKVENGRLLIVLSDK